MFTYEKAGVSLKRAQNFVDFLKEKCPDIGGFSGRFPLGKDFLVASTDGVGTKLKIASEWGKHRGIGIDLVAMCVNDIITCGARPLFFLDYLAVPKLKLDLAKELIEGVLEGCSLSNMSLLGGETAEMPGIYADSDYEIGRAHV